MNENHHSLQDIMWLIITDMETIKRDNVAYFIMRWLPCVSDEEHEHILAQLCINDKAYSILDALLCARKTDQITTNNTVVASEFTDTIKLQNLHYDKIMSDNVALYCANLNFLLTKTSANDIMEMLPKRLRAAFMRNILD